MGLFSRLFGGGAPNPTSDWPAATGQPPQISLERQALEGFGGRIAFGDPLDAARFLGRPEEFSSAGVGLYGLKYPQWGLTLDFELHKLANVSYVIGSGDGDAPVPGMTLAAPRGPDGQGLSFRTTRAEILQRFGEPGSKQEFDDETIFYYSVGPLVSEFQFDVDGNLLGWDVYVD